MYACARIGTRILWTPAATPLLTCSREVHPWACPCTLRGTVRCCPRPCQGLGDKRPNSSPRHDLGEASRSIVYTIYTLVVHMEDLGRSRKHVGSAFSCRIGSSGNLRPLSSGPEWAGWAAGPLRLGWKPCPAPVPSACRGHLRLPAQVRPVAPWGALAGSQESSSDPQPDLWNLSWAWVGLGSLK